MMGALRCMVVEDEPLALERMVEYVRRLPALTLVAACDNPADAVSQLQAHDVDLLFLDIRLGRWSGIELLERGVVRCQVVLTTAHQDYAARAFDLAVTDYLVKPFTFERFARAVDRVTEAAVPSPPPDFIFVKSGQRLERVALSEILVIEGQRDYRRIHLAGRRIMTLQTFGEFESLLPPRLVCRVHKSYMVGMARIDSIERGEIRVGGMTVPISDTYRDRFFSLTGRA